MKATNRLPGLVASATFGAVLFHAQSLGASRALDETSPDNKIPHEKTEIMVVSGSRHADALLNTPLSISLLENDILHETRAQHPSEMLSRVAGVWISRGDGQEHLTAIRSPVFSGSGACANFLIAEDGIPVRASGFCNVNQLFDTQYELAERVELFRGPNSSAYGSNALFGGILFFTPELRPERHFALSAAAYDSYRFNWKLAGQEQGFFGSLTHDQGYRDNTGVEQQKLAWKGRYQVGDWASTNTLQINHLEQDTAGFIEGADAYKDRALAKTNSVPGAWRDAHSLRFASHNSRQIDAQNRLQLTPYARHHRMDFLMHYLPWQPVEDNGHDSLGLQGSWSHQPNSRFTLHSGMDLEYTHARLRETQAEAAPSNAINLPQGEHYHYRVDSLNYAAFVHPNYALSERLSLSGNLRLDSIHYHYQNRLDDGFACAPEAPACRFYRPADRGNRFEFVSARGSLLYQLTGATAIYSSINRAFRAPQAAELYSAQAEVTDALEEVKSTGIEAGIRGQGRALNWQVALYAMRQSDGIYQNAERIYLTGTETTHRGIEYEASYQLDPRYQIAFGGTWSQHRYANSPDALGSTQNIEGKQIDTAPQTINSLILRWFPDSQTRLHASLQRMGSYYTDPENTVRYPGHTLLDLGAEYAVTPRFSLHLAIKNLSDTRYAERADVAFGNQRYFPGLPRRWLLELSWR